MSVKFDGFVDDLSIVTETCIQTNLQAAREAADKVMDLVRSFDYGEQDMFAIKLALEEALVNAVKHGNMRDPGKKIHMSYNVDASQVELCISDQGEGFDPDCVPDPTEQVNLEKTSGRGIMLMKAYMDKVEFCGCGNAVKMIRHKH